MIIRSLDKFLISGCLFLILLPQFLCAQSVVTIAQTPVHLQLEKTYFMAGDTADYVLQTAKDHNVWYLIDLYASADSGQAAAVYGELRNGKSAGSIILPDHLQEGMYWVRSQVEGLDYERFTPLYLFGKPKEIEPEDQPAFQLRAEAGHGRLFADISNQLHYELWPGPVMKNGRLIVRNQEGNILADTLLAESGKGIMEVRPDAGDKLQMELWLNNERLISTLLPEVVPISFDWQLTTEALELQGNVDDSISGGLTIYVSGPEGFELEEPLKTGVLHSLNYAFWPSGSYTLRLMQDDELLLKDNFNLREKEPALHLQQHEIPLNTPVQIQARVEGVKDIQNTRWQLRVYSAKQEVQLFSPRGNHQGQELRADEAAMQELVFERAEAMAAPMLNPERMQGVVKDSGGKPAPHAVVTLSGKGLGRMYYTISDEFGNFVFENLPLTGEERYLAAFDRGKYDLLHTDVAFPAPPPVSFPSYAVDTARLLQARSYAQKHFLLNLLQNKEGEKDEEETALTAIELTVPQDWISSYRAEDYVEFPSLSEFAQEVIPGLRIRYRDGKSYMQVLNIVNSRKKVYYSGEPLYLLNGYPVSSADSILSIDMAVIDRVQLVRNNASFDYGRLAQFGIVAVYTKEDKVAAHLPQEGRWLPQVRQSGSAADFSASRRKDTNGLPDFRQVISWNSVTKVQADGAFSFLLNSSDEAGRFIVELTIYCEDNRLIKLSHPLEVIGPSVP